MPVLKTNNKKYYSNKKIHAYEASIYTKENGPSAQTIYFIKQIAYSYHTMVQNGKLKVCYPN